MIRDCCFPKLSLLLTTRRHHLIFTAPFGHESHHVSRRLPGQAFFRRSLSFYRVWTHQKFRFTITIADDHMVSQIAAANARQAVSCNQRGDIRLMRNCPLESDPSQPPSVIQGTFAAAHPMLDAGHTVFRERLKYIHRHASHNTDRSRGLPRKLQKPNFKRY